VTIKPYQIQIYAENFMIRLTPQCLINNEFITAYF